MCKKLNFKGYRELQTSVKYSLGPNQRELVKQQLKEHDKSEITEFIKYLNKQTPIYIFGEGASKVSCLYLYRQLVKLGYISINLVDRELLYAIDNATVILISNSGETKKMITTAKRVSVNNNVKFLAITRENSTLTKSIKNCITHKIEINQLDKIQTEQQMHILYIINEIIAALYYN